MTKDAKRKNFTFRMKKELDEQITKEAKKKGISKNAYITAMLSESTEHKIS